MIRKIVKIAPQKCDGCGLCASACHEAAIVITDGKAKLLSDEYCDGLGDCLPVCPAGAITFEEREAAAYNETLVKKQQARITAHAPPACSCLGAHAYAIGHSTSAHDPANTVSELRQWPVKIKLVPVNAPYFDNAHLLIAADCAAYACGDFHSRFMKNKITLIGCPKLDNADYSDKLTEIIAGNNIKSVTVARMEVPCCSGIEQAVGVALKNSGKFLLRQVFTLTASGKETKTLTVNPSAEYYL